MFRNLEALKGGSKEQSRGRFEGRQAGGSSTGVSLRRQRRETEGRWNYMWKELRSSRRRLEYGGVGQEEQNRKNERFFFFARKACSKATCMLVVVSDVADYSVKCSIWSLGEFIFEKEEICLGDFLSSSTE